jgi:hypothetical protein
MQCRKGTYDTKGTQLPGKESQSFAKFHAGGGMLSICPSDDLESYVYAVEYYSQRKLTKQEDKMDAFEGIFRRYGSRIKQQAVLVVLWPPNMCLWPDHLLARPPIQSAPPQSSIPQLVMAGVEWRSLVRSEDASDSPYKPNDLQSRQLQ